MLTPLDTITEFFVFDFVAPFIIPSFDSYFYFHVMLLGEAAQWGKRHPPPLLCIAM